MSYYKTCPYCGANLDPGEWCDCTEKAAASAVNTRNGRMENGLQSCFSVAYDNRNMRRAQAWAE